MNKFDTFVIGWSVATMIGVAVIVFSPDKLQQQAIERGYALYCPNTGDFAWNDECDD